MEQGDGVGRTSLIGEQAAGHPLRKAEGDRHLDAVDVPHTHPAQSSTSAVTLAV